MFSKTTLFTLAFLLFTSSAFAKKCNLDSLPAKPIIPSGATANKEAMMEAREQVRDYESKATKMMKNCKGKPEFMTLLNNSYNASTQLDKEMSIYQQRSKVDVGGLRGDSLK
jgi:hypothetical protein